MNFFRTNSEDKRRKQLIDKADYVKRGGSLNALRPDDVTELQEYALDIKDIRLYDYLNQFWHGTKPGHVHDFAFVDCARPKVCACGEVQP